MSTASNKIESSSEVEITKIFFEEFKYRHENFWNILFKLSYAIAILYAAPYFFNNSLTKGDWLFPALGLALSLGGSALLHMEYKLLFCTESKYNGLKLNSICEVNRDDPKNPKRIGQFIYIFWGMLFSIVGIVELFFLVLPNAVP